MPYLADQILFDYFTECDRELTINDLSSYFKGLDFKDILRPVNSLIYKGWLEEANNSLCWRLTEKAKKAIKEDAEKTQQEVANKALEIEKIKIELELAKETLKEFPCTKSMARWAIIIAGFVFIIELIRILHELTSK